MSTLTPTPLAVIIGETVTIRATYSCVYWPDPESEDYADWGGWCDPANPWGTADDTYRPDDDGDAYDDGEPIPLTMTPDNAAAFLADFPGAIWDWSDDCEPSENYRTGVSTTVTAHVDGPGAETAFRLLARAEGVSS